MSLIQITGPEKDKVLVISKQLADRPNDPNEFASDLGHFIVEVGFMNYDEGPYAKAARTAAGMLHVMHIETERYFEKNDFSPFYFKMMSHLDYEATPLKQRIAFHLHSIEDKCIAVIRGVLVKAGAISGSVEGPLKLNVKDPNQLGMAFAFTLRSRMFEPLQSALVLPKIPAPRSTSPSDSQRPSSH